MTKIIRAATAGTLESSDAYIEVEPADSLLLEIDSVVLEQYGEAIRQVAKNTLQEQGVQAAKVRIVDRGALDCVIAARLETAILRGSKEV